MSYLKYHCCEYQVSRRKTVILGPTKRNLSPLTPATTGPCSDLGFDKILLIFYLSKCDLSYIGKWKIKVTVKISKLWRSVQCSVLYNLIIFTVTLIFHLHTEYTYQGNLKIDIHDILNIFSKLCYTLNEDSVIAFKGSI